jgi:hypothetical protein
MSLGTVHWRPENCHVGMPFVHNWLRKRSYTLCRICRGIGDLQLCYSPLGPLLLKNLEQNAVEQGKSISSSQQHCVFAPTRDVVRVATPARVAGRPGTTTGAPLRLLVPRLRTDVHTQTPIAARPTSTGWANRPCRRPTNGRIAVLGLRPRARRCRPHCPCCDPYCLPLPWCARKPPHRLELTYKRGVAVLLCATQRHQAAISAAFGAIVNPVLRPLSPPNRAAPTFLLHHKSFHTRLLARPSHQFAWAEVPVAAAAGLRRACPPVLSPPRVSTQIEPS